MKNWLKKVLSLLTAIALLISAGVLAFAEETEEPIDTAATENAVQNDAEEEAASQAAEEAAQKAAEEEAARKAAEEEAARKAAEEEAARKAAEEEAARKAAEEEAARKAAEEEAARKAAEEEAARKAAEEEAARKAAEEEAARKAAEEAARKAAEEEAARMAAEEAAAAQNANTSTPADDSVPSYNNEVAPETEAPAAENNDNSNGEVVEIDGWGYVDPEIIPDYVPDITTEIKFPEAVELRLNQAVSGSVDAENSAEYIFVYGSSKTVVLSLEASSEDVKVEINQKAARLTKDETVTSGYSATCELNVIAGNEYNIVLTSSVPVSYKLIVKDANTAQEATKETGSTSAPETNEEPEVNIKPEEDVFEGPVGAGKNTIVTDFTEQYGTPDNTNNTKETTDNSETDNTETDNTEAGNTETGNTEADNAENVETPEVEVPPMTGWISVNAGNYVIGNTVTLTAESDSELGDMVAWQTKVGNEGSWKGIGYGGTLTVELAEENNGSAYRFRMEDGNYSEEFVLTAGAEKADESEEVDTTEETEETEGTEEAEETEVTEGTEETEETDKSEETEETEEAEETEETEESEETEATEESGYIRVIITAEEGADLYAEADRESEVIGHLEAEEEVLVILNEEQTWGQIYNEDEESATVFISMEDVEIVTEEAEEAEETEETEESEESEQTEATEEFGYIRVIITAEEGADLYAEANRESEIVGHLEAEEEVLVILNEEQTWGQIYNEDEESATAFISMEDVEIVTEEVEEAEETEEEEAEQLTDEQLEELGYRKVQVLNENGADIYDSIGEEAVVIGHADFEDELWIVDTEDEGWAEIYTTEETKQYIKLSEIEKQPLTDSEIEELGYRKVQILNQNGTDIYDSTEEDAKVIGHADFESSLWIRDAEMEDWAEVYNEEGIQKFVKLDEIGKQMPSDEEMLKAGYIKVYVAMDIGANVYSKLTESEAEKAIDHLEFGTELWVKLIKGAERALIFNLDEEADPAYINLVDIIATLKPEEMEDLPTRMLEIHSSLEEYNFQVIFIGVYVTLNTDLINFMEDDIYSVQWQYSTDGEEFVDIEGANELSYRYLTDEENVNYIWKVQVILHAPEENND